MTQEAENKYIPIRELLEFFGSTPERPDEAHPTLTRRALRSFVSSCDNSDTEFPDAICAWVVGLQTQGTALSTAVRYVKALSGLYTKAVKAGLAPKTDLFKTLTTAITDEVWTDNINASDFQRFIALTKKALHAPGTPDPGADMVLFSLLNGCLSPEEMTRLKADETTDLETESLEIVKRNHAPRRQYVFPLNQSELTPHQLTRGARTRMARALARAGFFPTEDVGAFLQGLWARAALTAGFAPGAITAFLGTVPPQMRVLSLCRPTPLSESDRRKMKAATAEIFVENPLRWYAMRLRQKVSFEQLSGRLAQIGAGLTTFYPCREIARRVGRRMVFEDEPVIRDIVYFKSRVTEISPLFNSIGDLAWCYKTDGRGGNSYAAIPDRSFREFQAAIGCFTPEYATCFAPQAQLSPDDRVFVTGGPLTGLTGRVVKSAGETAEGVIHYIIEIWNEMRTRKISAEVDGRQVRRV